MSQAENDRTEAEALLEELLPEGEGPVEAVASEAADEAEAAVSEAAGSEAAVPDQAVPPEAGAWFDNSEPVTEAPQGDRTVQVMGPAGVHPMIEVAPTAPVESTFAQVPAAAPTTQMAAAAAPVQAELPSVHVQTVEEEPRSRRILPLLLAGFVVIGGFAAIGYWLGTRSSSDVGTDEAAGTAAESVDPAASGQEGQPAETDGDDTATDEADADADGATATATDGAGEADEESADADGASGGAADAEGAEDEADGEFPAELTSLTRSEIEELNLPHAVLDEGIIYVRGRVPNPAIVALTETRIEPLVGAGNYEVEFEVDPSVPLYVAAPLYVDDVVLYDFNGTDVSAEFDSLLARGTQLLELFPSTTVTIVAFTDAVGTEESNLLVSAERAQAVADYWIGRGIDESRITIDARGEEGASDDDDPETAAARRRVEFIFDGLLN